MTNLPSKELLSEVTGDNIANVTHENGRLTYGIKGVFGYKEPNIYELAHKCKEWVSKQGYQIRETYGFEMSWIEIGKHGHGFDEYFWRYDEPFIRPEAIFTTCQWVLDNKDKE